MTNNDNAWSDCRENPSAEHWEPSLLQKVMPWVFGIGWIGMIGIIIATGSFVPQLVVIMAAMTAVGYDTYQHVLPWGHRGAPSQK